MAWPMAITMQAMTTNSDDEVKACLELLKRSSAGTGLMHESFNVENVNDYTRLVHDDSL
jgi:meiotically up-regulated gene 157 (Mug157) protein